MEEWRSGGPVVIVPVSAPAVAAMDRDGLRSQVGPGSGGAGDQPRIQDNLGGSLNNWFLSENFRDFNVLIKII